MHGDFWPKTRPLKWNNRFTDNFQKTNLFRLNTNRKELQVKTIRTKSFLTCDLSAGSEHNSPAELQRRHHDFIKPGHTQDSSALQTSIYSVFIPAGTANTLTFHSLTGFHAISTVRHSHAAQR